MVEADIEICSKKISKNRENIKKTIVKLWKYHYENHYYYYSSSSSSSSSYYYYY